MLRAILVIAGKDLRQRSRDRSVYLMGIVGPLALVFIMNSTLGAVDEATAFELGLVDADGGQVAEGFVSLLAELEADGIVEVQPVDDAATLDRLVDDGDLPAGFVLPDGLTGAVQRGDRARIVVVGDPGAALTVDVAEAIAQGYASEVDYVSLAVASLLTRDPGLGVETIAEEALAVEAPIGFVPATTEGRGYDPATYYAVSLSVFFLFFTVQFGMLSLMEEREAGTLQRLLVSPIAPGALIIGKLISSVVIGLLTMAVLIVSTTVIVGAAWGDPLATAAIVLVGVLVAVALAMLVATVARTAEQAGAYASIAAVVLGLLGGTFFPLSFAPGLLNAISFVSPHRWLLEGFRDVSYGGSFADLYVGFAVLAAFIVIAGGIGLASARRRLVLA